jgi:WD40 repeat protein
MPDTELTAGRRWTRFLRFRLRTLFIAFTIVSLACGFVGLRWYRGLLEDWAVKNLQDAGARLVTDQHGHTVRVWLAGPTITDERLTQLTYDLVRLRLLNELDIVEAPITDEGLRNLYLLRQIKLLYIHETKATDAALDDLAKALPNAQLKREKPDPIASKLVARTIFRSAVVAMAFSPDGAWLTTGSGDGALRWWHEDASLPTETIQAHKDWLFTTAFSPDGKTLATGGGDNLIKLWDVATRELRGKLVGHTNDVHSIAFSRDGKTLYSAGDDRIVRVWDVASRKQMAELGGHEAPIPAIAISPNGRTLASASRDDTIRLWNIANRRPVHIRTLEGHRADVLALSFSPDNSYLASAGYDKNVRIWDVATGDERAVLSGHQDWAFAVTYFPDGKYIASGAGDGIITWDLATNKAVAKYADQRDASRLLFNPAGTHFYSSSADGTIVARNAATGAVEQSLGTRFGDRNLAMIRQY